MNKTLPTLFITAMLIILSPAGVNAAVDLPWETTYDCPEWLQYSDPLVCDGLGKGGGWTCSGQYEEITALANNPNGGGGRGQRHWEGDGTNQNSGGLSVSFTSSQPELWIRWYMRYEQGFQWNPYLHYDKILYIHTDDTPDCIPEFYGSDKISLAAQDTGGPPHDSVCDNCGWTTIMGGATSDGLWHCYEIHLKMDTDGTDGVGECWVDDVQVMSHNDINWGGTRGSTTGWIWFLIGSNQEHPSNNRCMAVDFDDIAISNTGYIGPISTTCGNGTCDPGETCLADSCCNGVTYNTATQVCCSGTIYTGDCCDNSDCTSPEICQSHVCTASLSADLNQDGSVNSIDFGIMMSYWGSTSYPSADLNQDGAVNTVDFGIMMSQWG